MNGPTRTWNTVVVGEDTPCWSGTRRHERHPLRAERTRYRSRSPWPTPPSRASHVDPAPERRLEPGSDPLSGRRQAQAAPGRARSRALTPTPAGGCHAAAGRAGSAACDVGG